MSNIRFFSTNIVGIKMSCLILDADGMTYLFDLDFAESQANYVIDAKYCGNVSHFINHSVSNFTDIFPIKIRHCNISFSFVIF